MYSNTQSICYHEDMLTVNINIKFTDRWYVIYRLVSDFKLNFFVLLYAKYAILSFLLKY